MNASSRIAEVRFDAKGLVANAGLVLPATLGERLGLPDLLRQHVHLGKVAGAANPEVKALTLIASLLAGGECVEDVNAAVSLPATACRSPGSSQLSTRGCGKLADRTRRLGGAVEDLAGRRPRQRSCVERCQVAHRVMRPRTERGSNARSPPSMDPGRGRRGGRADSAAWTCRRRSDVLDRFLRSADRGDRVQDHVRDDLWPRDHDHVRALDLGRRGAGALRHGADDITTNRLVAGSNHGPCRRGLPGGHSGRLDASANAPWTRARVRGRALEGLV